MSAIKDSPTWLIFGIFWAVSAIKIESIWVGCCQLIREALIFCILDTPRSVLVANNFEWAAVRIISYAIQPLRRGYDSKARAEAIRIAASASLSVAIAVALFRQDSPLASPKLSILIEGILSKFPWAPWAQRAVVLLWIISPTFQWFLVRQYKQFCRVAHLLSFFVNLGFVEVFLAYGQHLLRKHQGHLLRFVKKCLADIIESFLLGLILSYPLRPLLETFFGFEFEGSWMELNMYQALLLLFLYYLLYRYLLYNQRPDFPGRTATDTVQDNESVFIYDPLEQPDNIRLLLLHRRNPLDAIKCTLFEVSREEAPSYQAISYTWGNPLDTRHVQVNGYHLKIPKHAYKVLENQSSFWTPRLLWIDSICINQRDPDEKVCQIQLMKDIYTRASLVSVCLLPPEDVDNEIAECVLASYAVNELLWNNINRSKTELSIWQKYASRNRQPRWLALQNLLRNEWFDRVWVVQEVALASSLRVMYGKTEIPWQDLVDVMHMCTKHPSLSSALESTTDINIRQWQSTSMINAITMANFRTKFKEGQSKSLTFGSVIYSCYKFKATKPSDKIFGIQGLCAGNDSRLIPADYENPAQVFKSAADYLLTQETPFRLLSHAGIGHFSEPSPIVGPLPSWCPDWSRQPKSTLLSYISPEIDYQAWRNWGEENMMPNFPNSNNSSSLILQGRVIDTIVSLGPVFGISTDAAGRWHINELVRLVQSTRDSYDLILNSPCVQTPYPYTQPKQSLDEVYWRTLIGDRNQSTRPAPISCKDGFKTWLLLGDAWASQVLTPEIMNKYGNNTEFTGLVSTCAFSRRLCVTRLGYIGFVPLFSSAGDQICLIQAAQVPFVLRSAESHPVTSLNPNSHERRYRLVGEAYVHGIMDGDLIGRNVPEDFEMLLV